MHDMASIWIDSKNCVLNFGSDNLLKVRSESKKSLILWLSACERDFSPTSTIIFLIYFNFFNTISTHYLGICSQPVRCLAVIFAFFNPQLEPFALNWVMPQFTTWKAIIIINNNNQQSTNNNRQQQEVINFTLASLCWKLAKLRNIICSEHALGISQHSTAKFTIE
jgi:hypothetical protein